MAIIQYSLDNYQFKTRDDFLQAMTDEMKQVNQSFFRLGMYLTEAYQRRYNNGTGYDDFFEWCDDLFGLQKSSVYNLMRVYCVFRDKNRSDVGLIDERYSKFSQSQLVELLPAADDLEKLSFVKPSDSVSTIRDVVKINKNMRFRPHVDCDSSDEYISRFGACIKKAKTSSVKDSKLKGADAFNAVYNYLFNYFETDLDLKHRGGSVSIITRNIVYEILGL